MSNNFNCQHIEFIDGSNPRICTTRKEFERMKEKYVLEPVKEGVWRATFIIKYCVVCFADKNRNATLVKNYNTKYGAVKFIKTALERKEFELIVLREEKFYLKNNDELDISSSTPIGTYS